MSNKLRKMTLEKKHNLTGWAFLAPATFLIAVFSFWPMIKALVLSFQTGKGRNMQMAGFTNYIRMFQDDVFIQSIKNTFFYFILQVPIMLVVALVLACILNKKDLRFKGFFRTMIFLWETTHRYRVHREGWGRSGSTESAMGAGQRPVIDVCNYVGEMQIHLSCCGFRQFLHVA